MDIINYAKIKKVETDLTQHKLDYVEDMSNVNAQLAETSTALADIANDVKVRMVTRKHKMLFIGGGDIPIVYKTPFPEECFQAGITLEVCSYDAFAANYQQWCGRFDLLILNTDSCLQPQDISTPDQVVAGIAYWYNAGVKVLLMTGGKNTRLRKYNPDTTYVYADVMTALGSSLPFSTKNFTAKTGRFEHTETYPFAQEILRAECVPSSLILQSYTSSDPDVIFPVRAVQGETIANCVACKPKKWFVWNSGGSGGTTSDTTPYWQYINAGLVARMLLDDDIYARLAIDAQDGKKIAAFGIDADRTDDIEATTQLANYIPKDIPTEWGLVAKKVTNAVAGVYKSMIGNNRIVSHTYSHYASNERTTVTDEIHTIPTSQMVRLYQPYRAAIVSIKTVDDALTFTQKTGDILLTAPEPGKYIINAGTSAHTGPGQSMDGWIKFHADDVGKQIKVTYEISNEAQEVLGSLATLKQIGALTKPAVYSTMGSHSISAATVHLADAEGVIIADYHAHGLSFFPRCISEMGIHRPLFSGVTLKSQMHLSMVDVDWFRVSENTFKTVMFPYAINRCNVMHEPYVFYIHDFIITGLADGSYVADADWMQSTREDTIAYVGETYAWVFDQLKAQNPYWMTRSEYAERYEYLNAYLEYDVMRDEGVTRVYVSNTGKKPILGLTFRVETSAEPKSITASNGVCVGYNYIAEKDLTTCWFNLNSGESVVLTISQ